MAFCWRCIRIFYCISFFLICCMYVHCDWKYDTLINYHIWHNNGSEKGQNNATFDIQVSYWFLSKKPLFLDLYTSYACLYVFSHFITCITEGNRYQRLRKETQNTEYWKPKTKFIVWNILMCVCDNLFLLYRWHLLEKSSVTNCSPNCAVINIFGNELLTSNTFSYQHPTLFPRQQQ